MMLISAAAIHQLLIASLSIDHTTFDDVYHQQEMVVMVAVADDKLEGLRPPTRAYGNETQHRETAVIIWHAHQFARRFLW
jgi:hypothetical protein